MSSENDCLDILTWQKLELIKLVLLRKYLNRKKRAYMSDFNALHETKGAFKIAIPDLILSSDDLYLRYFRLTPAEFENLFDLLKIRLEKAGTRRLPVSGKQRLAVTLRILATGESFASTAIQHRLGMTTVKQIFHETCRTITEILKPIYLPPPNRETWEKSMENFYNIWNFPNCIGAIDGKHVALKAPPNSGSLFRNYKGFFSLVLMAVVDVAYNFTLVSIGAYGKQSDGGTFAKTQFAQKFEKGLYDLPNLIPLPNSITATPPVLVGDEAFPLKPYLMRPYPGRELDPEKRIFNYRLSRACRVVENAFGILAARWRIFLKTMEMLPKNADAVVSAAICLHNFCNTSRPHFSDQVEQIKEPGLFKNTIVSLAGNRHSKEAMNIRETLKNYFNSDNGAVSWQSDFVSRSLI